jgi:hypothetical protein
MTRVAADQDKLQNERNQFVYQQDIRVVSRRGNGKVMCRQDSHYAVAPKEKTSERTLASTTLTYWHDQQYVVLDRDAKDGEGTIDTALVHEFRDSVTKGDSKDGMQANLFPLTTSEQQKLEFELNGERSVKGRQAYVVRFRPRDTKDYGWVGEALIDKAEFQPASVYTKLSRKLPFAVRTLLGTDVPGLGFTITYVRVAKDVWFPSSFGTEFQVHAVYLFRRTISVSMQNVNFRRANVDSEIRFEATK